MQLICALVLLLLSSTTYLIVVVAFAKSATPCARSNGNNLARVFVLTMETRHRLCGCVTLIGQIENGYFGFFFLSIRSGLVFPPCTVAGECQYRFWSLILHDVIDDLVPNDWIHLMSAAVLMMIFIQPILIENRTNGSRLKRLDFQTIRIWLRK